MLASTLVLGLLLIYGSQDVLAFDSMTFSSVTQCGPFNVSFIGGKAPAALPLSLTILPFNSTNPLSIMIAPDAWDAKTSTGAAVTFLPFAAGMTFIASLDDGNGVGTGPVSDVIRIQPSSNSSCLPPGGGKNTSIIPYTLDDTLTQCLPFNISFNPTTENPPTVRAFTPKRPSLIINSTSQSSGMATFSMNAQRGEEVVLLLDDGHGSRQTTDLITIAGDSSSSTDCLQNQYQTGTAFPSQSSAAIKQGLSNGTIVGIVAGSVTVVGFIATLLVLFIYGERRRRLGDLHKFTNLESQSGTGGQEKDDLPQKTADLPPLPPSRPALSVVVPAALQPTARASRSTRRSVPSETVDVASLPMKSPEFIGYRDRGNESPWIQPGSPLRRAIRRPTIDPIPVPGSYEDHRELSTTPHSPQEQPELDIDQILDMATMYSLSPSSGTPPNQSFTPATISSHDHYHAPTDVPVGAERISAFYPSVLYPPSQARSPFADELGLNISIGSVAGGTQESEASPSLDRIPPVEIATATRVAAAVARVARVDS